MSHCRFYQLVYSRKREVVFGASYVKISKVDADSPLASFIIYEDWVGELVRVKCLSEEASSE